MDELKGLQSLPDEFLNSKQIRMRERMASVIADYKALMEQYEAFELASTNRICEQLASKHNISSRMVRHYLKKAGLIHSRQRTIWQ